MGRFEDDDFVECDICNCIIAPGESYFRFHGRNCCTEECVKDAMYDEYSKEVSEEYCMTAYDHECQYADLREDDDLC